MEKRLRKAGTPALLKKPLIIENMEHR